MVDINEGNHQQSSDKDKIDQGVYAEPEFHPGDPGKQACEQFNHGVADGYPGPTFAATTAQQDVADHRDVIVPFDRRIAYRARRRGANNGIALRKSVYAYIQKTADTHSH